MNEVFWEARKKRNTFCFQIEIVLRIFFSSHNFVLFCFWDDKRKVEKTHTKKKDKKEKSNETSRIKEKDFFFFPFRNERNQKKSKIFIRVFVFPIFLFRHKTKNSFVLKRGEREGRKSQITFKIFFSKFQKKTCIFCIVVKYKKKTCFLWSF